MTKYYFKLLIEIPILAGCSYNYENKEVSEVHREYFTNKVCIYLCKLPQGTHRYTVNLIPRYTGSYSINPARVELMYFPTYYAQNDIKKLVIE